MSILTAFTALLDDTIDKILSSDIGCRERLSYSEERIKYEESEVFIAHMLHINR